MALSFSNLQGFSIVKRQSTVTCKNGGTISDDGKSCRCHPAYSGTECDTLTCNNEPSICTNTFFFTRNLCANKNIGDLCPKLCGRCAVTTPARVECNESTMLECKNGGTFEKKYCACMCHPAYSGQLCDILTCSEQPKICSDTKVFNKTICDNKNFVNFCPILCGLC